MGLLDLLLRRQPDPTANWPPCTGDLPAVAVEPFALGPLRFGEHVELARPFGRPEKVRRSKQGGVYWLYYRRWGVELEFEDHKFAEIVFLIGDECWAGDKGAPRCQPQLDNGLQLTPATTIDDILTRFGPPRERDDDEDGETVLFYQTGQTHLDFEFNTGRLAAWHAFLDA
jgi:hypothetical protein